MPDIEDQIRKAMEEGQFDDLPGKGKPLRLDENPFEDPEWRLAFHILKNSGFTLPWLEARQEILSELDNQRAALARAWAQRMQATERGEPASTIQAEWQRALQVFQEALTRLNRQIRSLNLQIPSARFHLRSLSLAAELEAITQSKPPP